MNGIERVLTPVEADSVIWKKVKEYLELQLAERRAYNDGSSLDAVETAVVRGEIKAIKRILKL